MLHRQALSLICRLGTAALGAVIFSISAPALADFNTPDIAPRLSLSMSSLPEPGLSDDTLTLYEMPVVPQLSSTIDLTIQSKNLWERIRNGFAMTNLNDDLVLHYQQYYQNRPDALRRMIERSTYSRLTLPGSTPSAIRNAAVRAWSAMTRMETSSMSSLER